MRLAQRFLQSRTSAAFWPSSRLLAPSSSFSSSPSTNPSAQPTEVSTSSSSLLQKQPPPAGLAALIKLLRGHVDATMEKRQGPATTGLPRSRLEMQVRYAEPSAAADSKALWDAASPLFYRLGQQPQQPQQPQAADTIVPFDWHAAMAAVAATLPYEGVTEAAFVRQLQVQCPRLPANIAASLGHSGVGSLAAWTHAHFGASVLLTRSAATGEPLYHSHACNSMTPLTVAAVAGQQRQVAALQHALHLVGRDKALPVWTDFATLAPLLPAEVCPVAGRWAAFLSQPHVRAVFDMEASVLVRYAGEPTSTHLLVDLTSVSPDEAAAWLERRSTAEQDGAKTARDVKVLVRSGQAVGGALAGAETVLVERLLDPEHVIGALVADLAPRRAAATAEAAGASDGRTRRVDVLCGEAGAAAIAHTLGEVPCCVDGTLAVYVHTPAADATTPLAVAAHQQ